MKAVDYTHIPTGYKYGTNRDYATQTRSRRMFYPRYYVITNASDTIEDTVFD